MQAEPETAEKVVEEPTKPSADELAHEKFEKLCEWAKESIPGLGQRKPRPDLDPEELVPGPCDCELTNHGIHWKPARRTEEWADYIAALEEEGEDEA